MKVVATTTAARHCSELLHELPVRSEYLEACRDLYLNADGIERASNLDVVLRAAAKDTLPQGPENADRVSQRRAQKGSHRIVLPGVMGPVRTPAWRHFETTGFPPSYSLVEVTTPDRAVESVKIAETQVRPTGPRVMTVVCFGQSAKVDEWIQSQRGRHAKAKTMAAVWAYYRSCGIEAGPGACATFRRLPEYALCSNCKELIGPNVCVNENCREHDCTWFNELSGEPSEGDLRRTT